MSRNLLNLYALFLRRKSPASTSITHQTVTTCDLTSSTLREENRLELVRSSEESAGNVSFGDGLGETTMVTDELHNDANTNKSEIRTSRQCRSLSGFSPSDSSTNQSFSFKGQSEKGWKQGERDIRGFERKQRKSLSLSRLSYSGNGGRNNEKDWDDDKRSKRKSKSTFDLLMRPTVGMLGLAAASSMVDSLNTCNEDLYQVEAQLWRTSSESKVGNFNFIATLTSIRC
jgi:hypothetical protein